MTPERPQLDPDSEALRAAWISAVRKYHQARTGDVCKYNSKAYWDGGQCRQTSRVYKPKWPDFVRQARRQGVHNIVDLVPALFSTVVSDNVPLPSELVTPKNISRCRKIVEERKLRIAESLKTEESVYRLAVFNASMQFPSRDEACRFVLRDLGRPLSPLFRYCVARIMNMPDVATAWYTQAREQFDFDRVTYTQHWRPLLPAELLTANTDAGNNPATEPSRAS